MKYRIWVLVVAGMMFVGCGDDAVESLGLGPTLNSTAPQTVADSAFRTTPSGLRIHDFVDGTGDLDANLDVVADAVDRLHVGTRPLGLRESGPR